MSTDAAGRRFRHLAIVLLLGCAVAGCRTSPTPRLEAVCEGVPVVQRVTLSVDSLRPTAGVELHEIRGERYELVLTLLPAPRPGSCADRSGEATWQGFLPDALARATAGPGTASWDVSGTNVHVRLNPRVADNNLSLTLPLAGDEGRWDLSTFVGTIAGGRVILANRR
ncbi:MAG TPA: hypothetical protein VJ596_05530 [Gemmatimonadaceae bacterium]|nr:hypothetical protein [Gemmatimonadaceae bacterium]